MSKGKNCILSVIIEGTVFKYIKVLVAYEWFEKPLTSFDYSIISVFRKRLGAKRFEIIFQKLLEQIKQKGLLDDYKTQIIDSMLL